VRVELLEVKDGKFKFGVFAANDRGVQIGAGTHRRALINDRQRV